MDECLSHVGNQAPKKIGAHEKGRGGCSGGGGGVDGGAEDAGSWREQTSGVWSSDGGDDG